MTCVQSDSSQLYLHHLGLFGVFKYLQCCPGEKKAIFMTLWYMSEMLPSDFTDPVD